MWGGEWPTRPGQQPGDHHLPLRAPRDPPHRARLQLLEEFNRTNTQKITVDLTEGQAATTETKAKTLAAPAPPNLFYVAYFSVTEFLVGGMTVDVDTELKGDKDWGKQRGTSSPPCWRAACGGARWPGSRWTPTTRP